MRLAAAALALLVTAPLAAQQNAAAVPAKPHTFGWVLEGSLEMGGDLLGELLFTDGSTQKIYFGQGGTAAFGFELRPAALPNFGVRSTVGIKFTTNASENADISFTRIPVEVVGSYYLPRDWRVGAGLAYHASAKFNGDGFAPDVTYDPAAGATLELGWRWAALTYTSMEYKANGDSFDASAIGASFTWVFGKR
jgi:hypothetical protein